MLKIEDVTHKMQHGFNLECPNCGCRTFVETVTDCNELEAIVYKEDGKLSIQLEVISVETVGEALGMFCRDCFRLIELDESKGIVLANDNIINQGV